MSASLFCFNDGGVEELSRRFRGGEVSSVWDVDAVGWSRKCCIIRSSFISTAEELVDVAAVILCWFVSCSLRASSSVWKTRFSSSSSRLWAASACASAS